MVGVLSMLTSLCGILVALPLLSRASKIHGTIHVAVIDPGPDDLFFEWDFDYDGVEANFEAMQTGATVSHTYLNDGDVTVGPSIINEQVRAEMKRVLARIQNGEFAREFVMENQTGAATLKAKRRIAKAHRSVGRPPRLKTAKHPR